MKEGTRTLILDEYERGIMVNALNELRNSLIRKQRSTDAVEDLLIKTVDAPPAMQEQGKDSNETR